MWKNWNATVEMLARCCADINFGVFGNMLDREIGTSAYTVQTEANSRQPVLPDGSLGGGGRQISRCSVAIGWLSKSC